MASGAVDRGAATTSGGDGGAAAANEAAVGEQGADEEAEWQCFEAEHALVRQHLDALLEMHTCKVCLDRAIAGVLVPCGHLVLCRDCASRMKVGSACPICRVPATAFSLTFSA